MILCVISMFIYACECIGLRNTVIMMFLYLTMLYPINDLNLKYNRVEDREFLCFSKWAYIDLGLSFW